MTSSSFPAQPLFIRTPAKINLTLDVLGKRSDGFHDLLSVMQTIALYDTIAFWPMHEGVISLDCGLPELCGTDNLVYRAVELLRQETGCTYGVRIELHKAIPMQAGLGGGSSDGAATLVALNDWWQLGLDSATLMTLAAKLGSDVPFFIVGGTALIEGRGEIVRSLPDTSPFWLVVVKPPVNVPTANIFRTLQAHGYTDGSATRNLVNLIEHGKLPEFTDVNLLNALEPGAILQYPIIGLTKNSLFEAGAETVRMSGSGPTLYVPCLTLAEAVHVYAGAQATGAAAWLTHTVGKDK